MDHTLKKIIVHGETHKLTNDYTVMSLTYGRA